MAAATKPWSSTLPTPAMPCTMRLTPPTLTTPAARNGMCPTDTTTPTIAAAITSMPKKTATWCSRCRAVRCASSTASKSTVANVKKPTVFRKPETDTPFLLKRTKMAMSSHRRLTPGTFTIAARVRHLPTVQEKTVRKTRSLPTLATSQTWNSAIPTTPPFHIQTLVKSACSAPA